MRTAPFIRDNPEASGDCDWQDITNNWRDADATWLQERSIVRVVSTPDADTNLAHTHEGRTFYSTTDKVLYLSTTGGAPFSRVLASKSLVLDEGVPGSVAVGVVGHTDSGISFDTSTGNVTIGNLTITTLDTISSLTVGTLYVNQSMQITGSGGLLIETNGTNPVTMTTGPDGLFLTTGINMGGPLVCPTGDFGFLQSAGPTNLGPTTVDPSLTAAQSVTTPLVTAPSSTDLTVQIQSGKAVRFTSPTVGDANFFYGAGSAVRMAWVVVNANDPGVNTVPEGTIWIQP
jgi:hypothetical protein